jgi:hypothetical protein
MKPITQREAVEIQFGLMALALQKLMGKRRGYSGDVDPYANLRSASIVGVKPWQGVQVRILDKLSRRKNVVLSGATETQMSVEAFVDPYFDEINYVAIECGLAIEDLAREKDLELLKSASVHLVEAILKVGAEVGLHKSDLLPAEMRSAPASTYTLPVALQNS